MIHITMTDDDLKITGHAGTEACARVSQAYQIFVAFMNDYIVEIDFKHGYDYIKYKAPTRGNTVKFNKKFYDTFAEIFDQLAELYPAMINFTLIKGDKENGN